MAVNSGDVEIVPGVVGPRVVNNELSMPLPGGNLFTLWFSASFDEGQRRYLCDEVRLKREPGSGPITTEALRQVAIGDTVQGFLRILLLLDRGNDEQQPEVRQWIRNLPNPDGREPWGSKPPADLAAEGNSERVLAWVAQMYRIGAAIGDSPTQWVQANLGLSRTTAIRRVMAAREKGFLGEAEIGKAGERTNPA